LIKKLPKVKKIAQFGENSPNLVTLAKTYINVAHIGVAEKHDFCGIQQKILQVSDFAKKRDSNPPWGYCGRHCENVC
jgi:hypothetical protein